MLSISSGGDDHENDHDYEHYDEDDEHYDGNDASEIDFEYDDDNYVQDYPPQGCCGSDNDDDVDGVDDNGMQRI